MLNTFIAVNLESLADKLIDELSITWKSPFEAPVVIFIDKKQEQWFKLRWLAKKGVLANFNSKSLDTFIFELVSQNTSFINYLKAFVLRNIIISYLTQKTGSNYNYQLLNENVREYIEENGVMMEPRLFDFADYLANIYTNYLFSRPSDYEKKEDGSFATGILEAWKENKDFFDTDANGPRLKEEWQRKLFRQLFFEENSILERLSKNASEFALDNLSFHTLPQMYEAFKKANPKGLEIDSNSPVYIFALPTVGQFYRKVILDLAQNNDIELFLQSPCNQNATLLDNNALIRIWGKSGLEQVNFWSKNKSIWLDEKNPKNDQKSLFNCIQSLFAENKSSLELDYSQEGTMISIGSAPSKVREIELLHSNICKLLSGESTLDKKPAQIQDILVISPKLEEYKTAVLEVFAQSINKAKEEQQLNDNTVVSIPFTFADGTSGDSLIANALQTLFVIREKGALARPEFFALLRNPVVQTVRGINNEEISSWENWLSDMSIYRDRLDSNNHQRGMLEGVKRLLLAKLSNESILDEDREFVPYSNIDSSDNDSLCKFIEAIESLEKWLDKTAWKNEWGTDDISFKALDSVFDSLSQWLFMPNPPNALTSEAIIFSNIIKIKESLLVSFAAGSKSISWKIFSLILGSSAGNSDYSSGSLFAKGIPFMRFNPNCCIPAKYTFFIGIDAKSLPGNDNENTLDLRNSSNPWTGDATVSEKNRNAFLNQFLNTSKGFFISYVNKDLQKDEDFYPSSIITELKGLVKNANPEKECLIPEISLTIDENRPWEDLFTRRELRNKKTLTSYEGFFKSFKISSQKNEIRLPLMMRFYQLKSFLTDPFEFQVNSIMGTWNEGMDPEKILYEPIVVDSFDKAILKRQLVGLKLGISPIKGIESEEALRAFALHHGQIPEGIFGDKAWSEIESFVENYAEIIAVTFPQEKYEYKKISIESDIANKKGNYSWKICGEIGITAENETEFHVIDIMSSKKTPEPQYLLNAYIGALALIAEGKLEKKQVYIDMFYFGNSSKKNGIEKVVMNNSVTQIHQNKVTATYLLNAIYAKACMQKYAKVLPISLMQEDCSNFDLYLNYFNNGFQSPWDYFPARKLFEIRDVCGFTEENFSQQWKEEVEKQVALMPDIWPSFNQQEEEE